MLGRDDARAADLNGPSDLLVIGHRPAALDDVEPTLMLDADAIARSGATTLDEVLQRLPVSGFQGVNGNQNGGGFGATFVDLRNLNFNRTLVLINDRRVVPSGIQTDEAVDVGNIPISLVDRIEVMPYGTAPRYGADAVAGVVNIILKRDLSGGSLTATTGISDHGDGASKEISTSYGLGFDHGNVSLAASWMHRDAILQADRAGAREPIESASVAPDGELILQRGSSATVAGNAIAHSGELNGPIDRYDPAFASYLRPGLERATVSAVGHIDISATISAFLESSFSDRVALTRLPPEMLGLSGTTLHPDGFVVPASNPFNPYGEEVTLQRVLAEVGDQNTRTHNQLIRAVAGFEGTVFADTPWSLSVDHGDSRTTYSTQNAVNLTRALVSVDGLGGPVADYFGIDSLSAAAAAYIRFTDVTHSRYLENVVQANVSPSIELMHARLLTTHFGIEYRTEEGQTTPDPVVLAGDQAGGDSAATSGGYNSREAFAEASIPIAQDLPVTKSLSVGAAVRYVDTDLFGRFPVWRAGLSWIPVDNLLLRVATGIARRVPAITEAFGGSTNTPLAVTDPCDSSNGQLGNPVVAANCRELGLASTFHQSSALIAVANGGNSHLHPEYSRNFDVGLQLQPGLPRNVKIDLDYYKFIIHDAIDSLSDGDPNYIPDECLTNARLSSPLCQMITRVPSGPSAGQVSL